MSPVLNFPKFVQHIVFTSRTWSLNLGIQIVSEHIHLLTQLVKEPTRKEYLLDLAITDIGGSTVKVLPCIADHNALLVKIPRPAIEEEEIQREVWLLKQARWKIVKKELASIDWGCLRQGTAEDALNQFHEILWTILIKNIP